MSVRLARLVNARFFQKIYGYGTEDECWECVQDNLKFDIGYESIQCCLRKWLHQTIFKFSPVVCRSLSEFGIVNENSKLLSCITKLHSKF